MGLHRTILPPEYRLILILEGGHECPYYPRVHPHVTEAEAVMEGRYQRDVALTCIGFRVEEVQVVIEIPEGR